MNARPTGVPDRSYEPVAMVGCSNRTARLPVLSYGPTVRRSQPEGFNLNSPRINQNSVTVSKDQDEGFEDILAELDREEARVKIRMEMRRFGKPTTVIEGIKMSDKDLHELNSKMKRALATGGTVKDGIMILQGDHRESAAKMLKANGFSEGSIEII